MIYVTGEGPLAFTIAATLADYSMPVTMLISKEIDVPEYEIDLEEWVRRGIYKGYLRQQIYSKETLFPPHSTFWIADDTPIDEFLGRGHIVPISAKCSSIAQQAREYALIMISSQVPVGFTKHLIDTYPQHQWAVIPENLRRGHGIEDFHNRLMVVGLDDPKHRQLVANVIQWMNSEVEYVSIETAEMYKNAMNAFLATSIVFANAMDSISKSANADWDKVQRMMKADYRVGYGAYLKAGKADGRHLLRDVRYLIDQSYKSDCDDTEILQDIVRSHSWEN